MGIAKKLCIRKRIYFRDAVCVSDPIWETTHKIKYTQNILKSFAVPKGSVQLTHHNLFFGNRLPDRVYLAFVEQEAYNGHVNKNPFNFETAGMREASLLVNGASEPHPPFKFESGENEKDLYFNFLLNTGTSSCEMESVNVTMEEFQKGSFIIPFDRSLTKDNGLYTHKTEGGNMSITKTKTLSLT